MESGKTPRMEDLENGRQEIQGKIAGLTKGKGIIEGPSLQEKPTSWKDGIEPFIVPNQNNCCEQEELRKNSSERSNHVDMQQRCNLIDKKLKEIEGVDDLGNVDPKELCLVPDLVILPNFKIRNLKGTMEPNALRTIWPRIVTRWQGTPIMKIC